MPAKPYLKEQAINGDTHTPVILAIREAKVRELWSEASLR
jgi:hypothetical protein